MSVLDVINEVGCPAATSRIKVLHVYRTYFPDSQGGLEEVIRQICRAARQHGIESRVLSLSKAPSPKCVKFPEADVYRANLDLEILSCGISLEAIGIFKRLADWADIVHYHFPWPYADILSLVGGVRKPQILTYHSDVVRQKITGLLYRPLMHRFLSKMDVIVATSPNYAASSDVLSRYREKVAVIPIGIDEESYPLPSDEKVSELRGAYGKFFFLFLGVLRGYKGLPYLIHAAKGAAYSVVIAGKGPLEYGLKEIAHRNSVKNVHFLGYVSDDLKMALLKACGAVVLPSSLRSEAYGVALLEAAMSCKPMLSTELGTGTTFVNIDSVTGLVVPPADSARLRIAMDRLFSDVELAATYGSNARIRFESHFVAAAMGREYFRIYAALNEKTSKVGRN